MTKPEPLTSTGGKVRELDAYFFKKAKRGRPFLDARKKRVRLNFTLDPDVAAALRAADENASERVNRLLRKDLGL
ncbi:BrnA antitoxin family protein [uncultured Roseobacter sp.]|uniref:BrnA antitoxin family protein n=1 Tax=uncultured Roseobacter sp. TaxID=114847 RepID=UPI00261CDC4D|nr:BrnA antitoxin family protein [uncultured Roseobacter sp.]